VVAMGLRWGALQGPRGAARHWRRDKKDRKPYYACAYRGTSENVAHVRVCVYVYAYIRAAKNCAYVYLYGTHELAHSRTADPIETR